MRISQRQFVRVAAGILLNRNQRRNAATFAENATDQMPRTLGSDHHHVNIGGRNDRLEMNAEPVRHAEHLARWSGRLDRLFVEFALRLVGSEQVDPVGAFGCLVGRDHNHAIGSRLDALLRVGIETDDNLKSAVAEILRLGVPLAAVTE